MADMTIRDVVAQLLHHAEASKLGRDTCVVVTRLDSGKPDLPLIETQLVQDTDGALVELHVRGENTTDTELVKAVNDIERYLANGCTIAHAPFPSGEPAIRISDDMEAVLGHGDSLRSALCHAAARGRRLWDVEDQPREEDAS